MTVTAGSNFVRPVGLRNFPIAAAAAAALLLNSLFSTSREFETRRRKAAFSRALDRDRERER
jgi:hypothetical protein